MAKESLIREPINPLKSFADKPTYSKENRINGYNWFRNTKSIYRTNITQNSCEIYFNSSINNDVINENIVDTFSKMYETFDEFKKCVFGVRKVLILMNGWSLSTCTCLEWLKNYQCHHIFGLCGSMKLVEFNDEDKSFPLGVIKKPGRPPKIQKRNNKNNRTTSQNQQSV